jgi:hypothetical protein
MDPPGIGVAPIVPPNLQLIFRSPPDDTPKK